MVSYDSVNLSASAQPEIVPVTATLLYCPGQGPRPQLADALAREVIDTVGLDVNELPPERPPETPVVLVCIPLRLAGSELDALVDWAALESPPTGLIGHAVSGSPLDGEAALQAGFDDFVVGDVSVREMAARIRALFRRIQRVEQRKHAVHRFGEISLDPSQHQLWISGRRITLTKTELAVMQALIAARGRAMHRRELLDAGWGDQNFEIGERAVDNVILRLRRKLGDNSAIVTVRGIGFRLADDV